MFYVGLDLGQRRDHSAIAVVEKYDAVRPAHGAGRWTAAVEAPLVVRHVERAPLGTPYPKVVQRLKRIVGSDALAGQCAVAVDSTGVGAPVIEMLRGAGLGCEIAGVTITGGERESARYGAGGPEWSVPKRDLIVGLQVLLEEDRLKIARGLKDGASLVKELMDMRISRPDHRRVRMGAEGSGEHDDLVIAVALACWRAKRKQAGFVRARLAGI